MKYSKIASVAFAFGISAACLVGVTGCSNGNASANNSSGAVAATVNGTDIPEDEVTAYIQSLRTQQNLTDDDSWGNYLAQSSMTPSDVRQYVIDTYTQRELIKKGADEKGITVDSNEVDSYVNKTKSNYDTDDKWQAALSQAGMTEDEYRSEIELQLKAKALYETFANDDEPSQDDMLQYAKMYAQAYDGAKRSSHILFASDDQATAQDVLNRLKSGEITFEDAAKQYSTDTSSAQQGGDVGWDKLNQFVTEYQTALDGLNNGDMTQDLVQSEYGYHIIKCTDVYNAPKTTGDDGTETVDITSIDQIPSDWLDKIKSSLRSSKQSSAYQEFLDQEKQNSDIQVNDMPSGLPYDVDMSKYQSSDNSDSNSDSSSTDQSSAADNTTSSDATSNQSSSDQGDSTQKAA